ncbi:MAG: helix-turn-helix domain-containing protein [Candidatus Poseidoniaceae archaeon]|jgi:hypothetical protein|nr:helix-turn-helix domain-containing protein [Candidatus Poseidoniaceae archaeon]
MREVQLYWKPETVKRSEFGEIISITDIYEVLAHLDINENGVRQLVRVDFREGKGYNDLNQIEFLEVDGALDPHPMPKNGEEGILTIWNRHPISVAAINFDSLHVIPPYSIGKDGVNITIRGLPEGVSGFVKTARILFPPDSIKVVEIESLEENMLSVLTQKQIETAIIAVNTGYYNNPRDATMRDLSEITGIARSTLQEHLAKAEAALMKWAVKAHEGQ